MAALTDDARSHLDRYLRQVKAALRGHPSVDAAEVERDVLGHIDAELTGEPEPIDAASLRQVLGRLGPPDTWVPDDDLPAWRRTLNRLQSGPEDWRLAYLSIAFLLIGVLLFMWPRGWRLWPLDVLLIVASFLMARAALAVLAGHDEPIGARRWLIYPSLLFWYIPITGAILFWPLPLFEDAGTNHVLGGVLLSLGPTESRFIMPFIAIVALGLWWAILGLLLNAFRDATRVVFSPFLDRFDRRHALRVALTGLILATVSGGIVITLISYQPVVKVTASIEGGEAPRGRAGAPHDA